jgi:hypothetical protein
MIQLFDKETGASIGRITEAQLQFLVDHLEEESPSDQEYYLDQPTLEAFEEAGVDAELLALLRTALGDREAMEIRWQRS